MTTDREKVVAALLALDDRTPPAIVQVVARAVVAFMESELQWFAGEVGATEPTYAAIAIAVDRLKRDASNARQKTVLKHWEKKLTKIRASRVKGGRR